MDHYYQKIEGWFDWEDLYARAVADAPEGARLAEVGCWLGCSTAFLAVEAHNSGKAITIYAVDTWEGSAEHRGDPRLGDPLYRAFLENLSPVIGARATRTRVLPVRLPSVEAAARLVPLRFDLVFVDAAHDEASVAADLAAWAPLVRVGGLFAGHDYRIGWDGVDRAVDAFLAREPRFRREALSRSCWAARRQS